MTTFAATETILIDGLADEVEILFDRWGVPHIFAASEADVYMAQGFAVARDRLWQIDIWRKRGLGRLASDYGPTHAAADRAARRLLYRGDMEAEWAHYGADAKAAATSFVAGINAYIAWLSHHPARMPVEFTRSGTSPACWEADDCVRIRTHGPLFNFGRELARADVLNRHGPKGEAARRRLEPDWTMALPVGIAAEAIPPEVRREFELATGQPVFTPTTAPQADAGGSNNWAVAGHRTDSGRPILASDPHRLMLLPSLRYVTHLCAPGLNVIGAGEPAFPGIAVGHNEDSAFCFTIHPADQADLYVYELDPDDLERYRYDGAWHVMQIATESIAVRGEADRNERLLFTRHGPVLFVDGTRRRAYAIRSVWSEPGAAPYAAALRYLKTENWAQFVEARSFWKSPPVNHVYADRTGDIGWIMSGAVPIRPNWDGLAPVVGDGTFEWQGFMEAQAHPRIHNPACGWVASANEMNLPADFDIDTYKVGFEWPDSARSRVITAALSLSSSHRFDDSVALQTSVVSLPAQRLIKTLRDNVVGEGDAARARDFLIAWDGVLRPGDGAALLFEVWFRKHLLEAVAETLAPGALAHFDAHDISQFDTALVTDLMTAPNSQLGTDPVRIRDRILETTLAAAWIETIALAGSDATTWRWGDHHHALFEHPLAHLLNDETLNTRRVAKGGSGLTPNAADYRPGDFRMIVGASFRMVVDVGDWDKSVFINAPGQSGDSRDRHYDDHLEPWRQEQYVPLLFSRAAIEQHLAHRLRLSPASAPAR